MHLRASYRLFHRRRDNHRQTLLSMKFPLLLMSICCLQANAPAYSQTISLDLTNASLEQVFKEIKKQTGHRFVYARTEIRSSKPVTLSVTNQSLDYVLQAIFNNQPLSYVIEDSHVVIRKKMEAPLTLPPVSITGKVVNENGESLQGVTISVKGKNTATATNEKGEFTLSNLKTTDILIITSVGYQSQEIIIGKNEFLLVKLSIVINNLDETIVIAYGKTTRRLNTGSIGKVGADDISRQPVSNPLAALQGRVPGLFITQGNGLPGSNFSVLIRGRNSIENGSVPLFIIDGVPFSSDNLSQRSQLNANSPFNSINPLDIESIEILKDADATAIYGSRGANGVILITTKKGTSGKTKVEVDISRGWGKITRSMDMMHTPEYLQMRREAFKNDGAIPTASNAPDLLRWDTTRYTNWTKKLIGGTAGISKIQARLYGGNENTNFSLSTNYYKETTVFPSDEGNNRTSVNLGINHTSPGKAFTTAITAGYATDKSTLPRQDLTAFINLSPNSPPLYDSLSRLNWSEGGANFSNPIANLVRKYSGTIDRLTANALIDYHIIKELNVKASFGYNSIQYDELSTFPISSQNPASNPKGSSSIGSNDNRSWIIEPQIEYLKSINKLRVNALLGASWQENAASSFVIDASGYISDDLLQSVSAAASVTTTNSNYKYRYTAIFARMNLNLSDKYILNFTGRRDGSSRFGPNERFSNFGAVGFAWNFYHESFISKNLPVLSFGKLRGSYGVTGNDQIGDYQYLDTWINTPYAYQNQAGLYPIRLFNDKYSWERNLQMEFGIELGFAKDRATINASLFRKRSDNQLISYTLPTQTGFTGIIKNFPGVVQNQGIEISSVIFPIRKPELSWRITINWTKYVNKLKEFPGLNETAYAENYIIGKSLNIKRGYKYLGVDPQSGIYKFDDLNKDGTLNTEDYIYLGTLDPEFFGGIQNTIHYKSFEIDFLFQYIKQLGIDGIYGNMSRPGQRINQPSVLIDRWRNPSDISNYQKYTQSSISPAFKAGFNITNSGAALSDASYLRLKNLSVSYSIKFKPSSRLHFLSCRIYMTGQNLLTITSYNGSDPETQNRLSLPPLRVISTGIHLTL